MDNMDADSNFPVDEVTALIPKLAAGAVVKKSPANPKIVLDSGQVVYGCQVWWSQLEA